MSQLLKQLSEKRGSEIEKAQTIRDKVQAENRGLTDDERTQLRTINDIAEKLTSDITEEVRAISASSNNLPKLSRQEKRDVATMSIGRIFRSMVEGRTLDGVEAEIIEEGRKEARESGIQGGHIVLPRFAVRRENRDMTATGGSGGDQGGMTIVTEKRGLADDFYNGSIARQLGATVLEGLKGNIDLPRIVAGTAPTKKTENATAEEVSPTTAMLSLVPHRLPAFVDLGEQLLMQSDENIEAIVRASLTNQMLAIQEAAIFHGGGTNEPTGIFTAAGGTDVAGGTNGAAPTWAHLVGLETNVDAANALNGRLAYASNGQIRGKLKTTPKVASTDSIMLLDDRNPNVVNGYQIGFTNAISRTLTKGSSSVASAIFFGNFADLIMAYWGGLSFELHRDSANSVAGLYRLVASTYYNAGVIRPKSFAVMKDALGA